MDGQTDDGRTPGSSLLSGDKNNSGTDPIQFPSLDEADVSENGKLKGVWILKKTEMRRLF